MIITTKRATCGITYNNAKLQNKGISDEMAIKAIVLPA